LQKLSLTFLAGVMVAAYKAYALTLMWNWFVSPVFHIGAISFWYALGLLWVVQLFVGDIGDEPAQAWAWENAFMVLDYCVPEDKKGELKRKLEEKEGDVWVQMALVVLGQAAGVTFTLALGWLVHANFISAKVSGS
jgi:hypothetical protein